MTKRQLKARIDLALPWVLVLGAALWIAFLRRDILAYERLLTQVQHERALPGTSLTTTMHEAGLPVGVGSPDSSMAVVVVMAAADCLDCTSELRQLNRLHREISGIRALAVLTHGDAQLAREIAASEGVSFQVIADQRGELVRRLGVSPRIPFRALTIDGTIALSSIDRGFAADGFYRAARRLGGTGSPRLDTR